jgi:hypothetical protein
MYGNKNLQLVADLAEQIKKRQDNESKKFLGVVHTVGEVFEYYYVRTRSERGDSFKYLKLTITENGSRETEVTEEELPLNCKPM